MAPTLRAVRTLLSDRPLEWREPAHRTLMGAGAGSVATAWSDMTAWLVSWLSRTKFEPLRPAMLQPKVSVGLRMSWVVLVTVDVKTIQYWPAGTASAATS